MLLLTSDGAANGSYISTDTASAVGTADRVDTLKQGITREIV